MKANRKATASAILLLAGLAMAGTAPEGAPFAAGAAPAPAEEAGHDAISSESALDKKVTVNFRDLDLKAALQLISTQSEFPIEVSGEVNKRITLAASDRPLREILDQITSGNGLEYTVRDGTIQVSQPGAFASAASPAAAGEVRMITLKYANPGDITRKIAPLIGKMGRIMEDETTNSIIFLGDPASFEKVAQLVGMLDSMPKQILIQGLVIETSENFLQNLGFSGGSSSSSGVGALVNNAGPSAPNLAVSAATIAGHTLNLSLSAAESRGDAKVISRPKVVTMNNKPALINSGLTINVKTLSSTQSAQPGQTPVAVTGGLSQVNAGLNVTITPTIVGDGQVKLLISLNDSSPDNTESVDGIPGIQSNSASTTVIVGNNRTAIIAGLIKQQKSVAADGIPWLMDIPLLGHLFKNDNRTDQTNELAIFVTPTILSLESNDALYPKAPSPRELLDDVGKTHKARADSQSLSTGHSN